MELGRHDDESAEDEFLRSWFETRFSDEEKSRLSRAGRHIFLDDVDGKDENKVDISSNKENRLREDTNSHINAKTLYFLEYSELKQFLLS